MKLYNIVKLTAHNWQIFKKSTFRTRPTHKNYRTEAINICNISVHYTFKIINFLSGFANAGLSKLTKFIREMRVFYSNQKRDTKFIWPNNLSKCVINVTLNKHSDLLQARKDIELIREMRNPDP